MLGFIDILDLYNLYFHSFVNNFISLVTAECEGIDFGFAGSNNVMPALDAEITSVAQNSSFVYPS